MTQYTLDLPAKDRSTDEQINEVAEQDQRVVVSKDEDFVNSHLLQGKPTKLLLISTGNIRNADLEQLFVPLITDLVQEFQVHTFLELGQNGIIVRG